MSKYLFTIFIDKPISPASRSQPISQLRHFSFDFFVKLNHLFWALSSTSFSIKCWLLIHMCYFDIRNTLESETLSTDTFWPSLTWWATTSFTTPSPKSRQSVICFRVIKSRSNSSINGSEKVNRTVCQMHEVSVYPLKNILYNIKEEKNYLSLSRWMVVVHSRKIAVVNSTLPAGAVLPFNRYVMEKLGIWFRQKRWFTHHGSVANIAFHLINKIFIAVTRLL